MSKSDTAKVFTTGRSQAVRLPKEFRFDCECVRIRRVGNGVLLEPIFPDCKTLFEKIDEVGSDLILGNYVQPLAPAEQLDFD